MGKLARRSAVISAAALAGALALSTAASANVDGDPIDIDGNPEVSVPGGPDIYRFADVDRVGTALQAAQRTDLPWGDTVIIANSQVYADALAASPLADTLDAPVLLNAPATNSLRSDVLSYATSEFENVILVGGTDVFGNGVVSQLEGEGVDVLRISGVNRFQTAIALADAAINTGDYDTVNVFLASGRDFPDALTAGAAAADTDGIVLLTNGDTGLDAATYSYLVGTHPEYDTGYPHASIVAIGGPAAVAAEIGWQSDPVETDFDIVGVNRYETAILVADEYLDDATNFVIASGQNFPDAVVGGAYAANVDGALLLTREANLTQATAAYLESIRLDVSNVFVFGGPDSVSLAVSRQLANLNWWY